MAYVKKNHSTMPHLSGDQPVRRACRRSAANTPNWQVTLESTRTIVLTRANGTLNFSVPASQRPYEVDRSVK